MPNTVTNSALVGDIIVTARLQIPDIPQTLPAPTASFSVVTATGSTLPTGTYLLKVTQRNPWGETLATAESSAQVVGANQGIQVTSALLPGAVVIRAYLTLVGGATGSEIQWMESSTSPFTISTPPTGAGTPPTNATAYLPDSDGDTFGAATLYAWLNEGLKKLSRAVGGLLDYAGVPTVSGQPMYVLPGEWLNISDVWYGGYWIQGGRRGDFFRRNAVTSQVLNNVTISIFTDKQVMEVSYQPDRNSGTTTTTSVMAATDTSVPITSGGVFLLPFGFAQFGTGSNIEIVSYSNLASNTMAGMIRGIGSTTAQAWPNGTTVTELSLFWCGKRVFNTFYAPGSSALNLPAPSGWESILPLYVLARARESEQDSQNADRLMKMFFDEANKWFLANKGVASFVQVGGANVPMTYSNTPAGGLIVR